MLSPFSAAIRLSGQSYDLYPAPSSSSYLRYFRLLSVCQFTVWILQQLSGLRIMSITYFDAISMTASSFHSISLFCGRSSYGQKAKRVLLVLSHRLYPVLSLMNIFLVQHSSEFQTMTYSLGCLLIVVCCIYYFWELFQQKTFYQSCPATRFLDLFRTFVLLYVHFSALWAYSIL